MKYENCNSFVFELSDGQILKIRQHLESSGWDFSNPPNTRWKAVKDRVNLAAYNSGKVCIQGKGAYDFVTFILEPEIIGELLLDYEEAIEEAKKEEIFSPHAGIDESGKGDYFGPLVVAAVFVDATSDPLLKKAGVKDSKKVADKNIFKMAGIIRSVVGNGWTTVVIGPEAYNRLYDKIGNLNKLLAWGHSRALENIAEKVPECEWALADKFGDEKLIQKALMEKGRKIRLIQKVRAESDIAVAAASILARETFLKRLRELAVNSGNSLPKGASNMVEDAGRAIVESKGANFLKNVAKIHFKTTHKIISSVGISAKMPEKKRDVVD